MTNTLSKQASQSMWGKQSFLRLSPLNNTDIMQLLNSAVKLKKQSKAGIHQPHLKNKVLGMIFEKSSTRTRVSFEVGMYQLGGEAIFLSSSDIQLGRGESIYDTAKVLSRYVDGLMIRTFDQDFIETFAEHATIPVINGLTDSHHPTQVLADLLTIYEYKNTFQGLKLAYFGDGNNNMCHSLLEGAVKVGMDISIACPPGYEPDRQILEQMEYEAKLNGSSIIVSSDPSSVITDADVVITDTWASMGKEQEEEQRKKVFLPYQVNEDLCQQAKSDFIFLHCLPAHRDEEVTTKIIDGQHSVVFDEAENRLHAQKALLKLLLDDNTISC